MMKNEKNEPGGRCNAHRAPGVEFGKDDDATKLTKDNIPRKARVCFDGPNGPEICWLSGRNLWALRELVKAGVVGVTYINCPAPRWSAYIFNLRELGLKIEMIRERHGGPFSGTHARYVLRSPVAIEGCT